MQNGRCATAVCAIGVMAKAPQPGRSKTRLCPPLTHQQAAAMSGAFLRDITENIVLASAIAPIQGLIAYAPEGSEALFDGHIADGTDLLLAVGLPDMPVEIKGFGRCLLHATLGMFEQGYAAACVLNSDSPTLPTEYLVHAAQLLLAPGERVVLGAAEDGGYYLLGMQRAHARLFADIAWSTETVAQSTRERAAELGLEVVELPLWYDVDDRSSLARLFTETQAGPGHAHYHAPATALAIETMNLHTLDLATAAE